MDERDQQRKIRHRVAVLRHAAEVTDNVAHTWRYYGISRPTFYRWLSRYEELGEEGLRDNSSRSKTCPHETSSDVVGKIVYLRQNDHFGPYKISMYLKRYHDVDIEIADQPQLKRRRATHGAGGTFEDAKRLIHG